jgi:DNA repair protein RecN (Recombination protein N)
MLKSISIENFAIIDKVEIQFDHGLHIITGETGAGKSILLGALGLVMGQRIQSGIIKNQDLKCIVEAHFNISNYQLHTWFKNNEIDYNDYTILRREVLPGGKSRGFINDTPVSIQLLQELSVNLIDVFSQNDSLELKSSAFQLEILDSYAQNTDLKKAYQNTYRSFLTNKNQYESLIKNMEQNDKEKELIQYHFEEMSLFDFEEWQFNEMEKQLEIMENAIEIKQIISNATFAFRSSENSIYQVILDMLLKIKKFEHVSKDVQNYNHQANAALEDLLDAFKSFEQFENQMEFEEEQIIEAKEKVDFINKLLVKHKLQSFDELVELKKSYELKLSSLNTSDEQLELLKKNVVLLYKETTQKAEILSQSRKAVLEKIEDSIIKTLSYLGMENSQFKIWINSSIENLKESGYDDIRFLFSANKGIELQDIKNAISGGERNRFMLAIKSIMADKMHLPTLIFDEVDTGVSGAIAHKVALILERLANSHQIIAITHLPQIASKGKTHFWVYKDQSKESTTSNIKMLNGKERVEEIAKMISGSEVTETSLNAAKELLGRF